MSQNTSLTIANDHQQTWKGATHMLIKRIFLTLLITGVIGISVTATQAQSTGRKPWPRGNSVNNPIPTMSDQAAERAPVVEIQTASQALKAEKKTAIVGSWLGTLGDGTKVIVTYNSDGTAHASVQGEVSTNPELGVLTPTHGVWAYIGGQQFAVTMRGILYDINTGAYLGSIKIRILLTLNEAGDQTSGPDKVDLFDADGNLAGTFSTGTQHLARIKAEPFD